MKTYFFNLSRHLYVCVLSLFLTAPTLLCAQQFPPPPVNPDWTNATPDFVVPYLCEEQSRWCFNSVPVNTICGTQCPVEIPAPQIKGTSILSELGNNYLGSGQFGALYMNNTLIFEIQDTTIMRLELDISHDIPCFMGFGMIGSDAFNCIPGASSMTLPGTSFLMAKNVPQSPGIDYIGIAERVFLPGKYMVFFQAFYQDEITSMPCNGIKFHVTMTSLLPVVPQPGDLCSIPIQLEPAPTFNESRVHDSFEDAMDTGNLTCAVNDLGQGGRWFTFTATHTHHFLQGLRSGNSNVDMAIEVYESCDAALIVCQDTPGNNEVLILPTTIGQTYLVRMYHNGAVAPNSSAYSAALARVPGTQLRQADCGLMNLTNASIIRSDWPANTFMLTNWEFRFQEQEAPFNTYNIISPNGANPQFRISWFPQAEPGRTYKVWTRPRMYQGPTWGDFGDYCIIGMAGPSALQFNPLGTSANQHGSMQLFPNPAHSQYTISLEVSSDETFIELEVFDLNGKLLSTKNERVDGMSGHIHIVSETSALPSGIYLVRARIDNRVFHSKLQIVR